MHDRALRAAQRLEGAPDQRLARLRQHLDDDVVGNAALLDQPAHEVEVGLRRRREADLDFLVAHLHEQLEHAQLALAVHRLDQRLVAVAKVDAHQIGGRVSVFAGQVRSESAIGVNGRYLVVGSVFMRTSLCCSCIKVDGLRRLVLLRRLPCSNWG